MDMLREKIKERFILASNGQFLEWPADEQEAAIDEVFKYVSAATGEKV